MVDFIRLMDPKSIQIENSEEFFEDSNWVFEPKINGRRIQTLITDKIEFAGRYARDASENISSFSWKFREIVKDLQSFKLPKYTLFDGEVHLPGRSVSQTLQIINSDVDDAIRLQEQQGHLQYVIFDILAFDGISYTSRILSDRRKRLLSIVKPSRNVKLIEQVEDTKSKYNLWNKILNSTNEEKGVVFKFCESEYECDRSKWWRKLKKTETYDGIILGFKLHNKQPDEFVASIEIGQYRRGRLTSVANIGGLTKEQASDFRSDMNSYVGKVVQFRSELKTQNSYKTPRFDHLRYDKKPQQCIWEE